MRIVIGEDSALFREALAALLESTGHEVVARSATAEGTVDAARSLRPDLVVLDIRMPQDDEGLRAAAELRAQEDPLPVLLLSQHVVTTRTVELVRQGGIGYLLKDRVLDVRDFLDAAQRVAAGGTALDPEVVRTVLGGIAARSVLDPLSPREREVLALMAEGCSNRAIARRLVVSARTVETHISSIFTKLDLPESADEHRRVRAILAYLEASIAR